MTKQPVFCFSALPPGCLLSSWASGFGLSLPGLIGLMGAKLWFLDRMLWLGAETTDQRI